MPAARRAGDPADPPDPDDAPPAGWRRLWTRLSTTPPVRAVQSFLDHEMTDFAAAMTYHGLMSIFPAILIVLTIFGLLGDTTAPQRAADAIADNGGDPAVASIVHDILDQMLTASSGTVSFVLVLAVLLALNGASGAFQAAGRALNHVFDATERRGIVRRRLVSLGATLLVVVLYVATVAAVALGGEWAENVFDVIGLGPEAATTWDVLRWPVAIACAMLALFIVYVVAPDRRPGRPGRRAMFIGALVAVVLWLTATSLFLLYVRNFSHYGAVYGVAGALIILLIWLYLTNVAFLYGAELAAHLQDRSAERERAQAAG